MLVGLAGFFGGPGTLQEYQGAFGPPGQVEAGSLLSLVQEGVKKSKN